MKAEQIPGAVLSLKRVPIKMPRKTLVISIGSWVIIKRIISTKDIKLTLDIKEITKPYTIQIIVWDMPIIKPTKKYPKIKW